MRHPGPNPRARKTYIARKDVRQRNVSEDRRPGHVQKHQAVIQFRTPPATADEVRASALQFVRKVSGFTKPSKANEEAFNEAVDEVTAAARKLSSRW